MNKRELLFPYNALYYLLVINNCKFKKFYHQISFFKKSNQFKSSK